MADQDDKAPLEAGKPHKVEIEWEAPLEADPLPPVAPPAEPALEAATEAPVEEVKPEAKPSPQPPLEAAQPSPPARRGGFFAPFAGGLVAAALGFGVSHFDLLELRGADPALETRLAALDKALGEAQSTAKAAADQTAALAAKPAPLAKLPPDALSEVETLKSRLAEVEGALSQALSAAPSGEGIAPAALAALQKEIANLKAQETPQTSPEQIRALVDAEFAARAEAASAKAEAEAETLRENALRDAALIGLREAAQNGAPFADSLAALALPNVAPELSALAANGIPTLSALSASFPEAARQALEAALKAQAGSGMGDRFWSFLRIQTGARSLTPQEGSDPDAVLSRAEAALQAGDLPKALSEIAALPPEGQAPLAAWVKSAQERLAATAAIETLTATPAP